MTNKKKLFSAVRHIKSLKDAWAQIYKNGLKSLSPDTQSSVKEFKQNEYEYLNRIRRKLCKGEFNFDGIKGIVAKKSNKKSGSRPIVLSPPSVRIVQRSILDVLQQQEPIKKFLNVPCSFGAMKDKGVPKAIEAAVNAIKNGATHYIKSDIASFFTRIQRPKVLKIFSECFPDENQFISLIDKATNLEVQNLAELEKKYGSEFKKMFVFEDDTILNDGLYYDVKAYEVMNKNYVKT